MKPVLIIQNDPREGAGQLATLMERRGFGRHQVMGSEADYAELGADRFGALAILGGAQGAYETEQYPYLLDEMRLCEAFMKEGKPVAGFCLGAQILACALGGEVLPNARKEIGWHDLVLTEEAGDDPLLRDHPRRLLSYHFHGDFIKHVPGCVNLASSAMTEHQLFRHGSDVYGFQYHAEVDRPLLEIMCRNNRDYLAANGFDAETIIEQSAANLPEFERRSGLVLDRWLNLMEH